MPPDPTPKARPQLATPRPMVVQVSPQRLDDYRPSAAQRKWEAEQRAARERQAQEREAREATRLRYGQRRQREAALLAGQEGEGVALVEGTGRVGALLAREATLVLEQGGAPGGSVVRADDPLSPGRAILDTAALVAHLTARVQALAETVAALTEAVARWEGRRPGHATPAGRGATPKQTATAGAAQAGGVTYPTKEEGLRRERR